MLGFSWFVDCNSALEVNGLCHQSLRAGMILWAENHCVQSFACMSAQAKPDNPKEWLLKRLEDELTDESEDLSEAIANARSREPTPKDEI